MKPRETRYYSAVINGVNSDDSSDDWESEGSHSQLQYTTTYSNCEHSQEFPPAFFSVATHFDWKSPLFTIGVVIGVSTETIVLPLWINSFGKYLGGPYFILLFASICFAIGFCIILLCWQMTDRSLSAPPFSQYWYWFLLIGIFNGINGIMLVYASRPNRTPPLLQALLLNTGIIWAMITTRVLISKEEARLPYCRWQPLAALLAVLAGIMLSLSPLINSVVEGDTPIFSDNGGIVWSFIFMLSVAPGAIYNVCQEKFLKIRQRKEKQNPDRKKFFDMVVMLFWSCLFQLATIGGLFWADLIPHFGFSSNMSEFSNNVDNSFECYVGILSGCPDSWWYGLIFIAGYFLAYFCSAGLNESSANYNLIANTLGSPVSALFWIIFPSLNPENTNTPLWSVLPALALLVLGSVIWKWWENHERNKMKLIRYLSIQDD